MRKWVTAAAEAKIRQRRADRFMEPPSREHPFGVIELRLDAEGKGDGWVYAAAQIRFDEEGQLIIESWGLPPYSISEISRDD